MNQKIKQAIMLLDEIINDRTVPRNIREAAQRSKESLSDEKLEVAVKVDRVIQYMEEVSDDPNMPVYTRTQIWNIISILESMLS